jgi:hypothetical protein
VVLDVLQGLFDAPAALIHRTEFDSGIACSSSNEIAKMRTDPVGVTSRIGRTFVRFAAQLVGGRISERGRTQRDDATSSMTRPSYFRSQAAH